MLTTPTPSILTMSSGNLGGNRAGVCSKNRQQTHWLRKHVSHVACWVHQL